MFNVLRCPQCGHVITGQDDFINNIKSLIDKNIAKYNKKPNPMLLQENSVLKSYMKQVLHNQQCLETTKIESRQMMMALMAYGREKGFINDEALEIIRKNAREKRDKDISEASKKLEAVYGDFNNIYFNANKPDPTADKAISETGTFEVRASHIEACKRLRKHYQSK